MSLYMEARVMVVKDTSFFVINKHKGPHTCVNPCKTQEKFNFSKKWQNGNLPI